MTFEQLEFIVEVKRLGTILAASKSLNLSRPGISKAISSLEGELGVNVFLRTRAGTTVTPEGEEIIRLAQEILDRAKQLRQYADTGRLTGPIRLKAFPVDSMFFFSGAISDFRAVYPQVELVISQSEISDILHDLREQRVDLGLIALMQFQRSKLEGDIVFKTLFTSEMCVACSPDSSIANLTYVTPEDLADYPFVLHNDPLILENLGLLFAPVALPKIVAKTNDNALIKQMIAEGRALSTYTKTLARSETLVKQGKVVLVPMKCVGELEKVDFVYAYSAKKQLSPVERQFVRSLKASIMTFTEK